MFRTKGSLAEKRQSDSAWSYHTGWLEDLALSVQGRIPAHLTLDLE